MPNAANSPFRVMAYNNAWANYRLLSACKNLKSGEFIAPRIGFFPSLALTLNHNFTVDLFYIDAMQGGTLGYAAFDNECPYPEISALLEAQIGIDRRLIAVTEKLDDVTLSRNVKVMRGDRVQLERFDRLLLHLFQHQIHHRGQAHAMLSSTSVKPPQLDEFFSHGEADLRAKEFKALGWTEDLIWGKG